MQSWCNQPTPTTRRGQWGLFGLTMIFTIATAVPALVIGQRMAKRDREKEIKKRTEEDEKLIIQRRIDRLPNGSMTHLVSELKKLEELEIQALKDLRVSIAIVPCYGCITGIASKLNSTPNPNRFDTMVNYAIIQYGILISGISVFNIHNNTHTWKALKKIRIQRDGYIQEQLLLESANLTQTVRTQVPIPRFTNEHTIVLPENQDGTQKLLFSHKSSLYLLPFLCGDQ